MASMSRYLLIVPVLIVCTTVISVGIPPTPGFAVDAQPRIATDNITVSVMNADLASGGVQTLAIMNSTGTLVENVKPRLQPRVARQEITISTNEWARGMYLLVVADQSNKGIIKILKLQ